MSSRLVRIGFVVGSVAAALSCGSTNDASKPAATSTTVTGGGGTTSTSTAAVVKASGPCELLSTGTLTTIFGSAPPAGTADSGPTRDHCTWKKDGLTVETGRATKFLYDTMTKDPEASPYDGLDVPAIRNPHRDGPGVTVIALVDKKTVEVGISGVEPDEALLRGAIIEAVARHLGPA